MQVTFAAIGALGGLLLGVIFQFKPFAFIVLSAALCAAFVFSGRDWDARWRYATVLVIGGLAALSALGVKRGMKVALPNLTFWATFEAIVQLGAVPVPVSETLTDNAFLSGSDRRFH